MNFKKYHVSRNLFDGQLQQGYYTYSNGLYVLSDTYVCTHLIPCTENTTYTFRCINTGGGSKNYGYAFFDSSQNRIGADYISVLTEGDVVTHTATTPQNTAFLAINIAYGRRQPSVIRPSDITDFMLNTGSTALPYEPYSPEVWHNIPHYIHTTSTDAITTLPADLYADGNNATIGLVGNMQQTGTPTPQNPIQPQECGDLETEGAKAGQYEISVSSASTTTPVYLGEVETTRKIKKLVLTGEENIGFSGIPYYSVSDISRFSRIICSHFIFTTKNVKTELVNGECTTYVGAGYAIWFKLDNITNANDFKTYLQQQYANDTPVTVWYVLATETTGIINEPLRKIGDYADTVSGITIPTITGKDTFDVDTSLKPSEVELAYTGWHDAEVKEWDGSQWQ